MLLKTWKKNNRYTHRDIADMFAVSHRTVYNWIQRDAEIRGRKGERQIVIKDVVAREAV